MSHQNGKLLAGVKHLDFDIHGIVGIRLINPSESDTAALAKQLGHLQRPLLRAPDIVVRFVKSIPTPDLRFLGLDKNGFTEEGFFILRSNKQPIKVKIAFDQIGEQCEIVCETGLRSVPLLTAIINLSALKKDCVALHASAFVFNGTGVLVTGWAKGGKTEALLAFARRGARYVGDEWILLSGDGQKMYGIPDNLRLWDWHLEQVPEVRQQVKRETLLMFKIIHQLDRLQRKFGSHIPINYLREAMPALKRQLNVTLSPETVFGEAGSVLEAAPEKIFLMVSHDQPHTCVESADALHIARMMVSSIAYEQLPFMEHYAAFTFAFPELRNEFIESAHNRQCDILCRALIGKEAYIVRHPYPFSFAELYDKMKPFCAQSFWRIA